MEETLAMKKELEIHFLELGKRLSKIMIDRIFEPNFENFDEFLCEMKMGRATASKLINIYLKFVLEFKFKPKELAEAGGWSVIAEVLPIVKTREEADDWLNKMRTLNRADLRREIVEIQKGVSMAKCKHKNSYLLRICNECGDRIREYDET